MEMKVEIISGECIKPSSPTPTYLKTVKLTLFEQFSSPSYLPIVLYYLMENNGTKLSPMEIDRIVSKRLQLLKQSLSETLTLYYPLAGRMKDVISVDCDDEGIYFVEARVKSTPLSEFLNQPDLSLIHKFLPIEASNSCPVAGSKAAKIQLTTFACGGFVIGVLGSHMIVDGMALISFLKSWGATACKSTDQEIIRPNYVASFPFIQNDASTTGMTYAARNAPFLKTGGGIMRRFVFDTPAIVSLKNKARSSTVQNPTRVEVVSAFLSKCIMSAFKAKSAGLNQPTLLSHAVNLRRSASPRLPKDFMGCFGWEAVLLCPNEKVELGELICHMRKAITKLKEDFVKSLQRDGGLFNLSEIIKDHDVAYAGAKEKINYTSLCNFGLNDVNFGWGKPIWAFCPGLERSPVTIFQNFASLMDTRSGDGIEAWVYLHEEDMGILQLDKELLSFASLDPSPLRLGNNPLSLL